MAQSHVEVVELMRPLSCKVVFFLIKVRVDSDMEEEAACEMFQIFHTSVRAVASITFRNLDENPERDHWPRAETVRARPT